MKYTTDILSEIQTWCHYADVVPAYETIEYGALYNWYAATDVRNICASGWHVPTKANCQTLMEYYDPDGIHNNNTAGGNLKETGYTYWQSPNTDAVNDSKFNARGAGSRSYSNGVFNSLESQYFFWNSDSWFGAGMFSYMIFNAGVFYTGKGAFMFTASAKTGHSIRLMKDSTTLTHGQTSTYTGNDGKVYRTICIGTQEWLADNLCETKYRNGDAIPVVTDNATWAALVTGAMCYYDNDISNA